MLGILVRLLKWVLPNGLSESLIVDSKKCAFRDISERLSLDSDPKSVDEKATRVRIAARLRPFWPQAAKRRLSDQQTKHVLMVNRKATIQWANPLQTRCLLGLTKWHFWLLSNVVDDANTEIERKKVHRPAKMCQIWNYCDITIVHVARKRRKQQY